MVAAKVTWITRKIGHYLRAYLCAYMPDCCVYFWTLEH